MQTTVPFPMVLRYSRGVLATAAAAAAMRRSDLTRGPAAACTRTLKAACCSLKRVPSLCKCVLRKSRIEVTTASSDPRRR